MKSSVCTSALRDINFIYRGCQVKDRPPHFDGSIYAEWLSKQIEIRVLNADFRPSGSIFCKKLFKFHIKSYTIPELSMKIVKGHVTSARIFSAKRYPGPL